MKTALFWLCLAAASVIGLSSLRAADTLPADPAAQAEFDQLEAENSAAFAKLHDAYFAARTDADKKKVIESLYPKPAAYTPRFFDVATKYPGMSAALDALVWIIRHSPGDRAGQARAVKLLHADYLQSDRIGPACLALTYADPTEAESFLRDILAKNPHHDVQGFACLSLGQLLKNHDQTAPEVEKCFERAVADYRDVKIYEGRTVGDLAAGELFEIRNLAVGKTAPEIEGADVDGKNFKLSDYRGKVVVLDFWGRW